MIFLLSSSCWKYFLNLSFCKSRIFKVRHDLKWLEFIIVRSQCDQMLEKKVANFLKSCPNRSNIKCFLKMMFLKRPKNFPNILAILLKKLSTRNLKKNCSIWSHCSFVMTWLGVQKAEGVSAKPTEERLFRGIHEASKNRIVSVRRRRTCWASKTAKYCRLRR